MSAPLYPRCGTDTCVKCRKKFKTGDRVVIVNIIERLGVNPNNIRESGAWLTGEFEMTHALCNDPQIDTHITVTGL